MREAFARAKARCEIRVQRIFPEALRRLPQSRAQARDSPGLVSRGGHVIQTTRLVWDWHNPFMYHAALCVL